MKRYVPFIIAGLFVLISVSFAGYFYFQYKKTQAKLSNPNLLAQEETKAIVKAVGNLMVLPTDETPTIANITDVEKLANQPFFARAQNGDSVLIYTNAKKAILFRKTLNKIIEVAAFSVGATESAAPLVSPTGQQVTFAIRNGTDTMGLASQFETELLAKIPTARVVDRDNANTLGYQKSLLIDVKGDKTELARQYAENFGFTISTLPSGESVPASDFLVILGSD